MRKNAKSCFGHKNPINFQAENKLNRTFEVSPLNVQNKQILADLIGSDNEDPEIWVHGAYRCKGTEALPEVGACRGDQYRLTRDLWHMTMPRGHLELADDGVQEVSRPDCPRPPECNRPFAKMF